MDYSKLSESKIVEALRKNSEAIANMVRDDELLRRRISSAFSIIRFSSRATSALRRELATVRSGVRYGGISPVLPSEAQQKSILEWRRGL
jgi:hypothetical protein